MTFCIITIPSFRCAVIKCNYSCVAEKSGHFGSSALEHMITGIYHALDINCLFIFAFKTYIIVFKSFILDKLLCQTIFSNSLCFFSFPGLFPAVLNLASMAEISANATCGSLGPEMFCKLVEHVPGQPVRNPQCRICNQRSVKPFGRRSHTKRHKHSR